MIDYDHRKSTENWAELDYDRSLWFPVPLGFQGTKWADAAEWAYGYSLDRFRRGGRELNKKIVKKEVVPFAERLVVARQVVAGHIGGHKLYCHCPDYTKLPTLVSIGLWKPMGDWQQAIQYYAYWGTKTATTQPMAEWFTTDALGTGVKAQWSGSGVNGDPTTYEQVNYVFRDETYATDVHVFLMSWDHARYVEVLPDLDNLVRAIRCIPDPETQS